jgi:hypothetical protein
MQIKLYRDKVVIRRNLDLGWFGFIVADQVMQVRVDDR